MNSRKQVWIAALCLLSIAVIGVSRKVRLATVHAAGMSARVSQSVSAQPVTHLTTVSLRDAVNREAMTLDDDASVSRVAGNLPPSHVVFPPIQQFTLTPPNPQQGMTKTELSVLFPTSTAAKLASQIPMNLAGQDVVLQRSAANPSLFMTSLDFNWERFTQEQAKRKEAAIQGRMMPVFDGRRFLRTERIQFVDPAQITEALASHQPIHFSPQILAGSGQFNVFPDHQLIMSDLAVVNDNGVTIQGTPRTFDPCLPSGQQGDPNGAWTFNTLMLAIAGTTSQNPQPAENMLLGMLNSWNANQFVNNNNFEVLARTRMGQLNIPGVQTGTGLLSNWPIDTNLSNTACTGLNGPTACPSLAGAPVRLEGIVNRIDLGLNGAPFPPAGELRFVFTVTTDANPGAGVCQQNLAFPVNIILEYNVPSNITPLTWANAWATLQDVSLPFDENYLSSLKSTITDPVVGRGACGGSSCIAQIRTNELLLAPLPGSGQPNTGLWELREFHFRNVSTPTIFETTIAQTPDPSFNTTGTPSCGNVNNGACDLNQVLASYINAKAFDPVFLASKGAAPPVPNSWMGTPFLGGSSLNNVGFWNGSGIASGNEPIRIDFSVNTCLGCHGAETATGFQHFTPRTPTTASVLSAFLLGNPKCPLSTENLGQGGTSCRELVPDPNTAFNISTQFGDVARRVQYLQTVCGDSACDGGSGNDLLLPFTNRPIGVH
jgi:hypothetical protein